MKCDYQDKREHDENTETHGLHFPVMDTGTLAAPRVMCVLAAPSETPQPIKQRQKTIQNATSSQLYLRGLFSTTRHPGKQAEGKGAAVCGRVSACAVCAA